MLGDDKIASEAGHGAIGLQHHVLVALLVALLVVLGLVELGCSTMC